MKLRLFYKIFCAFIIVALLPVLVGSFLFNHNLREYLFNDIRSDAQLSLEKSALLINHSLQHYDEVLTFTSKSLFMSPSDTPKLNFFYLTHPNIHKLVVVDMDGIVQNSMARYEYIPKGSKLKNCNPETLNQRNVKFGHWNNEPLICLNYPIISMTTGKHKGALFAKININSMFDTFVKNTTEGRIQYIVNAKTKKVIFHPDFNLVLNAQSAADIPAIKNLIVDNNFSHEVYVNFAGETVTGSAIHLSEIPLILVEESLQTKTHLILKNHTQSFLNIILASTMFILFAAFLFSRSITKPINRLKKATSLISRGEIETEITLPKRYFSDEIVDFGQDFQTMAMALKQDRLERDDAVEKEQRALQKLAAAEKMKTIGLLAGGVAHDLNNILSGIIGYPQLLLMKLPEDSPLRPSIKAIQNSGEKASAMVADLLTMTRGIAAERKPHCLNTIITDYCSSPELKTLLTNHPNIEISKNLDENLFNIECSPIHVIKSLMNLVTNAAEASNNSGKVTITTENRVISLTESMQQQIKPGNYTILRVADTGSGITKDDLEHIFEPFYTKKKMGRTSGTGLGLTIVWNTMQDHGGTITVNSTASGTIFELFFPATNGDKLMPTDPNDTDFPQGKGEKVLVVDDIDQQRDLASQILTTLGYSVETVQSGEEAIRFIKKNTVDLVLLDMIMDPGINGRETYANIVKLYPNQKAVIASGYSKNEEVVKTLALGANCFVQKPYNMMSIAVAIRNALNKP